MALIKFLPVYGLPKQLVSDNASNFASHERKTFPRVNGIHQFSQVVYGLPKQLVSDNASNFAS